MNKSEIRIQNNRIRRENERRKNILSFVMTICLISALSLTVNGFLSNAQSRAEDVEYKYYKSVMVQQGDTLWSIALENMGIKYSDADTYVNEVKRMNNLNDDNIIIGSYLIIPYFSDEFII